MSKDKSPKPMPKPSTTTLDNLKKIKPFPDNAYARSGNSTSCVKK